MNDTSIPLPHRLFVSETQLAALRFTTSSDASDLGGLQEQRLAVANISSIEHCILMPRDRSGAQAVLWRDLNMTSVADFLDGWVLVHRA